MRFDVSDLKLFRAVVEAGSMTGAATRIHRTVASVSERVKQMEREVGVPLLLRSRAGVSATEAGRVLLHHASKVLRQVDVMNDDLTAYAARLRSNVRLYANTYAVMEFLTQPIQRFLDLAPEADLTLEEHLSEDIVHAVGSGAADIGLIGHFVDVAGLEILPFRRDALVAIVGERNPLRGVADFDDLLEFDFVGLGRGSRLQESFATHARERGRPLRHRVQARNLDAICRLVASGSGVAIVPGLTAARYASLGLHVVALRDAWATYELNLCIRKRADLSASAAVLADCLMQDAASV